MSFHPYPQYKDSGVAWLGEIPNEWKPVPLKYNLHLQTEKSDGHPNTVALENIESWSGRFIETDSEFSGDGVSFSTGDILFGKLRPYLAKAYLATTEGAAVGDFHVLRPEPNTVSKFAQYQILNHQFIDMIDSSTYGAKMPRVSWDFMGNVVLATPPKQEQTLIARFLDHETGKIDGLIAEQEKLIELLKEKRQATISHAVTKGLNPDAVPMKDSGVEWLGEVPKHWENRKISHAYSYIGGGTTPPSSEPKWYEDGIIPWVTTGELRENTIQCTKKMVTEEAVQNISSLKIHPKGSLLIALYGATIGRMGFLGIDATCNQACCVLAEPTTLTSQYTFYWLLAFKEQIIELHSTGGGQPNISQEVVLSLRLPAPPLDEQIKITEHLERETIKLDALLAEALRGIELLKERRTALISAAVTGKIDVRNWKPQGEAV